MRIPHNLKTSIFAIDYITMIEFHEIKDICGILKTLFITGTKVFFGALSNVQTRLRLTR